MTGPIVPADGVERRECAWTVCHGYDARVWPPRPNPLVPLLVLGGGALFAAGAAGLLGRPFGLLVGIGLMVGGFTIGLLSATRDSGDLVRTLAEFAAVTDRTLPGRARGVDADALVRDRGGRRRVIGWGLWWALVVALWLAIFAVGQLGGEPRPFAVALIGLMLTGWVAALAQRRGWRWALTWLVALVALPVVLAAVHRPLAAAGIGAVLLCGLAVVPGPRLISIMLHLPPSPPRHER
jgi:hypothetical protein